MPRTCACQDTSSVRSPCPSPQDTCSRGHVLMRTFVLHRCIAWDSHSLWQSRLLGSHSKSPLPSGAPHLPSYCLSSWLCSCCLHMAHEFPVKRRQNCANSYVKDPAIAAGSSLTAVLSESWQSTGKGRLPKSRGSCGWCSGQGGGCIF